MTKQHVRVELYYDRTWNTHAPYTRDQISITRDRGDEQGEPVTGSAVMTFPGHELNPNNAASSLYGKVQQNTPLRISVSDDPVLEDNFNRSVSNAWTGGSFTWSLAGGTVPDDYDVNGTSGVHTHTNTNTYRVSTVDCGQSDHRVRAIFEVDQDDITGNPATVQIRGRVTDANNYYALEVQYSTAEVVTASISKRVAGVGSTIAGPVTVATMTGAATTDLIGELYVEGSRIYGRVWRRTADAEPLTWTISATDSSLTTGTSVALSGRRETGNTNSNLQIRFHDFLAVPGTIRFAGECASFKPRRAVGDVEYGSDGVPVKGDRWVAVTANGVLRRMGQGDPPALSALWVENLRGNPLAMWPLNDGANATQAGSALPGGTPMSIASADFAGTPLTPQWTPTSYGYWLDPLPTPPLEARLLYTGPIAMSASATEWAGDFVAVLSTDITSSGGVAVTWQGTGNYYDDSNPRVDWQLLIADTAWQLTRFRWTFTNPSSTVIDSGSVTFKTGSIIHIRFTTVRDGADVDYNVLANNVSIGSGTATGSDWEPLGSAQAIVGATTAGSAAVGFITAWDTASPPANAANAAVVGRAGELAADRLARLCLENDDIPFELIGDSADTEAMGPQPIATFVEHVADIERTESGRVFESRHQPGLTMRTRKSLLAQSPLLTVDVDDEGVAPPLEPDVDDLGVVNDVTVVRLDGSSARSVQEDGPLGIDTIGRRPRRFDVNTDVDTDLATHADWRRSQGTQRGTRYPQVPVDVVAAPSLALAASRVDTGHVLALDNAEPDQALLMALGYTETIGSHTREIAFNTGLAKVFDAGIYNDSATRYDTPYSTNTGTVITGTTTSVSVATEAGHKLWVTGSGSPQFPFEIEIEGARLSVTAISGASSPQTFTVTATPTNGVIKTIASGAQVRLAKPKRYGF